MSGERQIVGVAVVYDNQLYTKPAPYRHHHVIREIGGIKGPHQEGFVDADGKFLTRSEAFQLALSNGQYKRKAFPGSYNGDQLYSEDLW